MEMLVFIDAFLYICLPLYSFSSFVTGALSLETPQLLILLGLVIAVIINIPILLMMLSISQP